MLRQGPKDQKEPAFGRTIPAWAESKDRDLAVGKHLQVAPRLPGVSASWTQAVERVGVLG